MGPRFIVSNVASINTGASLKGGTGRRPIYGRTQEKINWLGIEED